MEEFLRDTVEVIVIINAVTEKQTELNKKSKGTSDPHDLAELVKIALIHEERYNLKSNQIHPIETMTQRFVQPSTELENMMTRELKAGLLDAK